MARSPVSGDTLVCHRTRTGHCRHRRSAFQPYVYTGRLQRGRGVNKHKEELDRPVLLQYLLIIYGTCANLAGAIGMFSLPDSHQGLFFTSRRSSWWCFGQPQTKRLPSHPRGHMQPGCGISARLTALLCLGYRPGPLPSHTLASPTSNTPAFPATTSRLPRRCSCPPAKQQKP